MLPTRARLERSEELAKRDPREPYPKMVAMALAALSGHDDAATRYRQARQIDARDGLLAYYEASAGSWKADRAAVDSLMVEAEGLPRYPSWIEIALDPHFTGLD